MGYVIPICMFVLLFQKNIMVSAVPSSQSNFAPSGESSLEPSRQPTMQPTELPTLPYYYNTACNGWCD